MKPTNILEYGRKDAGGNADQLDDRQIKQAVLDLKGATDEVKRFAEEAATELKNLGTVTAATKTAADDALLKHTEVSSRLDTIEQKLARPAGGEQAEVKSLGQQFAESEELKEFIAKGGKGRARFGVKAIISSLTTDANGSAGDLIIPQRMPGIVGPQQRRLVMRDLVSVGRTSSNAIQYVKETGFTNSAATVSETSGPTKPQSEIKFDLVTSNVSTIAHWVLATRQILDDVPMLMSYINGRLRYGLAYVEDNQILNGGGTGTDLNGIYTQATAFAAPFTIADPTRIDVLRMALLNAFLAEYQPDGIVLNPTDWAAIEMVKDSAGGYIIGNPTQEGTPRLWGKPVVETQAMTVDKYLVGAFKMGAELFDREDAHVEVSTEDSDNFRKNLVTVLAEERAALAVYRPEAFRKGDFSDDIAAATT